jgi:hypothetical protein
VVSFTALSLYPQGKSPWYSLDRRLGGPQNLSGCGGEEKNSQPPQGIKHQNPDPPAHSLVTILTELSWLSGYSIKEPKIPELKNSKLLWRERVFVLLPTFLVLYIPDTREILC